MTPEMMAPKKRATRRVAPTKANRIVFDYEGAGPPAPGLSRANSAASFLVR